MPKPPMILVIDDDPDFHEIARWIIEKHGYVVETVESFESITRQTLNPSVVMIDWRLGSADGTDLIQMLRRRYPSTPVVLVTGFSSPDIAVTAIKRGAFDFLAKPLDEARLITCLAKAVEHHLVLQRLEELGGQDSEIKFEGMIAASPQMRTIFSVIRNIAPTDVNVMIAGESGTGKELAANALHRRSLRASKPFVAHNMASIPSELLEATLFGHEKGSFTGANAKRIGLVEEAEGGTLFLDEITEMPLDLQPKLLRYLQEKVYRPVGASSDRHSDVRIISATNCDPIAEVNEGNFRADLYYRLNVVPVELPPLRERDGDIPLLANHAVRIYSELHGKAFREIDEDALRVLVAYDWPGNVRQLFHLLQRVVLLNEGEIVRAHHIPQEPFHTAPPLHDPHQAETAETSASVVRTGPPGHAFQAGNNQPIVPIVELERRAIIHALDVCGGSAYEAARKLGISAATMYRKIKLLGLYQDKSA